MKKLPTLPELKALLKTPKGKLLAACGALVLCWLVIALCYFGDVIFSAPDAAKIANLRLEIKKQTKTHDVAIREGKNADVLRVKYHALLNEAWHAERDGSVESELRLKVSDAARNAGLSLNNLGAVRITKVNAHLSFAEVDVSGFGSLPELVDFLKIIRAMQPRFYWQRLDLRPDRRADRNRAAQSIVSLGTMDNKPASSGLTFNGNLRVLCSDQALPAVKKGEKTR